MSAGSGPIFIGGLSGSGKTQLRMVLGAHPELCLTRRTALWHRYYGRFGTLSNPVNLERCIAAMVADPRLRQLDPDWDEVRRDLATGTSYTHLFASLHAQHARRLGKRRWGEQLQFVECFADSIFAELPDARIVHMVRHPAGTVTKRSKVGWDVATWLHSASVAHDNQQRYAGRYLVVRYETLATRPDDTVVAVCDFVGEPFTPAMADELTGVRFDAVDDDEREPAGESFVDMYTRRALRQLGYAREVQPARQQLARALPMWPVDRMTMAAWRVTRGGALSRRARASS